MCIDDYERVRIMRGCKSTTAVGALTEWTRNGNDTCHSLATCWLASTCACAVVPPLVLLCQTVRNTGFGRNPEPPIQHVKPRNYIKPDSVAATLHVDEDPPATAPRKDRVQIV